MVKKRNHGDGALYPITRTRRRADGSSYTQTLYRGVVDRGVDPATGKRVQATVHARTKSACKEKLDDLRKEIAEHGAPLKKGATVAAWGEQWLREFQRDNVDPNTLKSYTGHLRNWIVPAIGKRPVAALTPSDWNTVSKTIDAADRGLSTKKGVHGTLRRLIKAAVAERLCTTNFMDGVPTPGERSTKDKILPTKRGALTTDQVTAILAAASTQPFSAGSRWWFKMMSGQRQGEILGARLADLDLARGMYTVNWKLEDLRREHGCEGETPPAHPRGHVWACGKKQGAACPQARWMVPSEFDKEHLFGAWHLTAPKSQRGREVPLPPSLAEAMRRHIEATADWPNPHGLIWRDKAGRPFLPKVDNDQWRAVLLAAGVITAAQAAPGANPFTGHWTRHTAITALGRLGTDNKVVRDIMGHASEQISDRYRHIQDTERREAMERLATEWALEG